MLDLTRLIISTSYAQEAVPAAPADAQSAIMNYLPFILIFGVFYFLVIRPQQKKFAEQEKMIKALQRGDRVVTSGGIHGKITKMEEGSQIMLEIAEGIQIRIDRDNVAALEVKPVPAPNVISKIEGEKK